MSTISAVSLMRRRRAAAAALARDAADDHDFHVLRVPLFAKSEWVYFLYCVCSNGNLHGLKGRMGRRWLKESDRTRLRRRTPIGARALR